MPVAESYALAVIPVGKLPEIESISKVVFGRLVIVIVALCSVALSPSVIVMLEATIATAFAPVSEPAISVKVVAKPVGGLTTPVSEAVVIAVIAGAVWVVTTLPVVVVVTAPDVSELVDEPEYAISVAEVKIKVLVSVSKVADTP